MQHETDTNYDFDQEQIDSASSAQSGEAVEAEAAPVMKQKKALNAAGLIDLAKQNWLYALIGLVGLVVVWYLFTTILFPSEPAPAVPVKHQVAPSVPQQQWIDTSKPAVAKAPVATAAPVVNTVASNSVMLSKEDMRTLVQGFQGVVTQQMTGVSQHMDQSIAQLQQATQAGQLVIAKNQQTAAQEVQVAQEQVTLLKQQVADINTKFDQYNQNLLKMGQALTATQEQLKLLVAEKAQDAEQLTLRAVVPGRAWLVNADGHTVTVTKGTNLPHYGTVTKIDSDEGKVYTSSGYVFN